MNSIAGESGARFVEEGLRAEIQSPMLSRERDEMGIVEGEDG
jgi:hypothetical protein